MMPTSPEDMNEVSLHWGVKIPLRDGVRLNATVYLPKGLTRPAPTIVTLTPYIAQNYHAQAMYFASHGLPFLTIDVRGRGNSEGIFDPNINEAKDGCDVVEWIAQQSYCNGKVAMWGGSYAGHDQWAAAKELPPHLATIVPVAAPFLGVDFPIRCNISGPYLMKWLTLVWGRTYQDRFFWNNEQFWESRFRQWFESGEPFRTLDERLGCPSEIFQEWIAHPEQGAHWDRYNPTAEQYARLSIPILSITGIYDGDQPGTLEHYRQHIRHASHSARATHYLVIGPWDHTGTRFPSLEFCGLEVGAASLVDLPRLHLQWYAWTMQGGPKPDFLNKNVAYYVMGADRWRYADTLEEITSHHVELFLDSVTNPVDVFRSGMLSAQPAARQEPDHYRHDPLEVSCAAFESTVDSDSVTDQRMVLARTGKHLVYHTEPFTDEVEISGFFKLSAWIGIDTPDTDFNASVYEIDVSGNSVLLTSDSIRARYRESLRQPRLVSTLEPLHYDFERFTFVSRRLGRGSRLRLIVGPIHSIYSQKNYNSGGCVSDESSKGARTVTVRLFHDSLRPSALYVPFGRPAESPDEPAAPPAAFLCASSPLR